VRDGICGLRHPKSSGIHLQFAIREYRILIKVMALKPQDLLVVLKIALHPGQASTYAILATELGMAASEVHAATKRGIKSGLLSPRLWERKGPADASRPKQLLWYRANNSALIEFVVHGVKYVFPPERGAEARGLPTAHGTAPLNAHIAADRSPVWPTVDGVVRGESLAPLYPSAPTAAKNDPLLHQALALVDAIRGGAARERKLGAELFVQLLNAQLGRAP
jgi:hypothetical protein